MELLNSFVFHSVEILIFYGLAWKTNNFGMVDFGWPLGFTLSALYYNLIQNTPWTLLSSMISFGYLLCGLRFMLGWLKRHQNGREDHRWALWRQKWSEGQRTLIPNQTSIPLNLLVFYLLQGWANALFLTVPLKVVSESASSPWTAWQTTGCLLFLLGFTIENIADYQLTMFKHKKLHQKVLDTGLWAYSRHPNYFGEWMIWLGYAIYALPLTQTPMDMLRVFFCPLVAYWFLVHMTGIPVTEEASCQRRPAYRLYQKRVNAFFPRWS